MALCRKIIDLVRLHLLHDADQIGGVGEVTVMQNQLAIILVRVLIEMIDTLGVEERRPAFDTVHRIAFPDEEVGEVSTILAGNAGDERDSGEVAVFPCSSNLDRPGGCLPPSVVVGLQPRFVMRVTSSNFCGVPSGLLISHSTGPRKPTIWATCEARSLMETSSPQPMLMRWRAASGQWSGSGQATAHL